MDDGLLLYLYFHCNNNNWCQICRGEKGLAANNLMLVPATLSRAG